MNLYKVSFDNNKAVTANRVEVFPASNVSVQIINGCKRVNWITIFANDARESIQLANKLVADCLRSVGRG